MNRQIRRNVEQRLAVIKEVNMAQRRIVVEDQYGTRLYISTQFVDPLTAIPSVNEVWSIQRQGSEWFLGQRRDTRLETTSLESMGPGDYRIAATGDLNLEAANVIVNGTNINNLLPAGAIMPFGGSASPTGYVLADGANYDGTTATYAALWAVFGTTYGGSGQSSFAVPNLKGRAIVGVDAAQTEFDARGETGGAKTHTLSVAEMPSHNHGGGDHNHTYTGFRVAVNLNDPFNAGATYGTMANQSTSQSGTIITTQGSGTAHNILQPYIALNYIVKL